MKEEVEGLEEKEVRLEEEEMGEELALFIKGSSASINSPPINGSTSAKLLQKSIVAAIIIPKIEFSFY